VGEKEAGNRWWRREIIVVDCVALVFTKLRSPNNLYMLYWLPILILSLYFVHNVTKWVMSFYNIEILIFYSDENLGHNITILIEMSSYMIEYIKVIYFICQFLNSTHTFSKIFRRNARGIT
jgi:hypothetical protein